MVLLCCQVVLCLHVLAPSLRTCEQPFSCHRRAAGGGCNIFGHTLPGCALGSILSQWLLLLIGIPVVVKLLGGFTFPWLGISFGCTCQLDIMSLPFCSQDV